MLCVCCGENGRLWVTSLSLRLQTGPASKPKEKCVWYSLLRNRWAIERRTYRYIDLYSGRSVYEPSQYNYNSKRDQDYESYPFFNKKMNITLFDFCFNVSYFFLLKIFLYYL